jgi:hypothetical protein
MLLLYAVGISSEIIMVSTQFTFSTFSQSLQLPCFCFPLSDRHVAASTSTPKRHPDSPHSPTHQQPRSLSTTLIQFDITPKGSKTVHTRQTRVKTRLPGHIDDDCCVDVIRKAATLARHLIRLALNLFWTEPRSDNIQQARPCGRIPLSLYADSDSLSVRDGRELRLFTAWGVCASEAVLRGNTCHILIFVALCCQYHREQCFPVCWS